MFMFGGYFGQDVVFEGVFVFEVISSFFEVFGCVIFGFYFWYVWIFCIE